MPQAFHDKEEPARVREADAQRDSFVGWLEMRFDVAAETVQGNRSAVATWINDFHTGSGASREKRQHGIPMERRAVAKPKDVLIFRLRSTLMGELPDLCWSSVVDPTDGRVKTTNAPEAGGKSDLPHGQCGFVDQFFGEVQPASLRYGDWRRTKMLEE